jgi:hypothetical protein
MLNEFKHWFDSRFYFCHCKRNVNLMHAGFNKDIFILSENYDKVDDHNEGTNLSTLATNIYDYFYTIVLRQEGKKKTVKTLSNVAHMQIFS